MVFGPARGPQVPAGAQVLMFGGLGLAPLQFGWLANPLLLVTLVLFVQRHPMRRTMFVTAISLGPCAVDSMALMAWPRFSGFADAFAGFYLWLAACLCGTAAALLRSLDSKLVPNDEPI